MAGGIAPAAASTDPPLLPEVVVTTALAATTDDPEAYTSSAPVFIATGLPLSLQETPQPATVTTRQQIDDQHLRTLEDIAPAVPGLALSRDQFYARGFALDTLMLDGLNTTFDKTVDLANSLAMYERIEIVRGAAGLVQGPGNPSATLNLVRKRPTADARISLTGHLGSWGRHGATLDVSRSLNSAGSLRGRFVAEQREEGSFQPTVSRRNSTFYGILEADTGQHTTLSLGASRQSSANRDTWAGIPTAPDGSDLHLRRSTYLGNDWDHWDQYTTTVFGQLEHRLANGWRLRLDALHSHSAFDYLGTYLSGGTPTDMRQNLGQYRYTNRQSSYALSSNGTFSGFGRRHELAFGASQRNFTAGGQGQTVFDFATGMDVRAWDPHRIAKPNLDALAPYAYHYSPSSQTAQKGVWLTTRLSLSERLKLVLGARLDWYRQHSVIQDSFTSLRTDLSASHHLSRYGGLIHDLDAHHSLYASFADIFQPRTQQDVAGRLLPPSTGQTYATGLKGSYFGDTLHAGVHLFQTEQKNQPALLDSQASCPGFPVSTCYQASGLVRSQGVELEIHGALTPAWQIMASHSSIHSRYVDDPVRQGQRFEPQLPGRQLKLATVYRLPGGQWRIGGNLYRQSAISNQGHDALTGFHYRMQQPAYTLAGLMVSHQPTRNLHLQLNINNLLDQRYYQSIEAPTLTSYGAPRNVMLTAHYQL